MTNDNELKMTLQISFFDNEEKLMTLLHWKIFIENDFDKELNQILTKTFK